MSNSDSAPANPADERMGRVLREVVANGGDPPRDELAVIATRSWMRQAKLDGVEAAPPKDIIKIPPREEVVQPAKPVVPTANLRKWVLRAWIGAVAALIALAFVWIWLSTLPEQAPQVADNRGMGVPPMNEDAGSRPVEKPAPQDLAPKKSVKKKSEDQPLVSVPNDQTVLPANSESNRSRSDAVAKTDVASKVDAPPPELESVPPVKNPWSGTVSPAPSVPSASNAAAAEVPGDEEITFVAGMDIIVTGRPIRPANLETFKIIERETQRPVEMHWSTLEPSERKRVQKLFGMDISDGRLVYGERVTGTRFNLVSGKCIVGLALPKYDFNGQRALKTCNAPLLMIHEYDIKSEEPVECFESYFYSPRELYDRWIAEKQPGNDASAHLEFARKCANLGLYQEGIYHLKCAAVIDPRTIETNADFRMEMIKRDADKLALELYEKMLLACATRDYFAAGEYLGKLDRNFPNSQHKTKWEARRAEIELGGKIELKKQVIFLSYAMALDLIRDEISRRVKIDAKGNVVPSIPGKLVTTKHGDIFRGTLISSDDSGLTILEGNMNLTIDHKDILAIKDVDLSVGVREVPLSFDDMKEFITDTRRTDGLKMRMLVNVAKRLKVSVKEVVDLFDTRTVVNGKYNGDHVVSDPKFSSFHDATYDKGSWLRDGAKPLPLIPDSGDVRTLRPRNSRGGAYGPLAKPVEDPELSDDPNIWWANQSTETKFNILRAFAAEKVFKAKDVVEQRCADCGGTGTVTVSGPGGRPVTYRCPRCRGVKVLYKILYE